jgi:hypothetical protein
VEEHLVPLGELYGTLCYNSSMKSRSLKTIIVLTPIILLLVGFHPAKGDIILTNEGFDFHAAQGPYIRDLTNKTYDSGFLSLYVNFHAAIFGNVWFSMNYSLDGKENETINLVDHYFGFFKQTGGHPDKNYLDGFIELPVLANGSHCITVYLECKWETGDSVGSHIHRGFDSQRVYFSVLSPIVLFMHQSYNTTEIPLDFSINDTASPIIYSLDSQANVTISGNTTITGLTEGTHSINIVTPDAEWHWVNFDTATFNVTLPSPNPKPSLTSPTLLLLTVLLSIVAAISIMIFLRKRGVKQPIIFFYKRYTERIVYCRLKHSSRHRV